MLSGVIEGLDYAPARWSIAANDLVRLPAAYSELSMVLALRQWLRKEAATSPKSDDWLSRR